MVLKKIADSVSRSCTYEFRVFAAVSVLTIILCRTPMRVEWIETAAMISAFAGLAYGYIRENASDKEL